jgi:hypothetical protein
VTREDEDDEVAHLIELYDGKGPAIMARIENQLMVLASRAQTLLSLAGITITVTGFSGANIAKSSKLASLCIVAGLVLVLLSAAMTIGGILRVEWTTRVPKGSLDNAIRSALRTRDQKTLAYSRALKVLIIGLSLYVASVVLLLVGALVSP